MTFERLPGNFGVKLHGIDIGAAVSEELQRTIFRLLVGHRFVVLPGQSLDHDSYAAFGRRWGRPVLLISEKNRTATHPEIIRQGNAEATPAFLRNIANHWHCDSSYEEEVAVTTMLYGVQAPEHGGETLFADLVAAYEALPQEQRHESDRYQVRHATSAAIPLPDETIVRPDDLPDEYRKTVKPPAPVLHPLVQHHPVNGRKALYGLGGSAYGIEGLPDEEGSALLLALRRHAAQPQFCASYKLLPNDVLIWDNYSVMHRATPIAYSDRPGERRENYRISLKGLPGWS
jgi:taurine dioxygenase